MSFTAWVDVAIGLTLVYLGASLFVTVINEYIAQLFNMRGRKLRESLMSLIDEESVKGYLTSNPAIRPFFDTAAKLIPSYVDTRVFARLLIGGLASGATAATAFQQVTASLKQLPESQLKTQILALANTADQSIDSLIASTDEWIDRSLTGLGGIYKRHLQYISFGVGLVVVVTFNLDSVALTSRLYRDKSIRDAAAAFASQLTEITDQAAIEKCETMNSSDRRATPSCAFMDELISAAQGRNAAIGDIPIGWPASDEGVGGVKPGVGEDLWIWASRILGWVLTALALSLGAPFWFDLLSRIVNMRHGMRKPTIHIPGGSS